LVFLLSTSGFSGLFRIYFADNSRKNARYSDLSVIEVYFEGFTEKFYSTKVSYFTDASMFVERHAQWILEKLRRENSEIYH
jgi:hypothetical protein